MSDKTFAYVMQGLITHVSVNDRLRPVESAHVDESGKRVIVLADGGQAVAA